MPGMPAGHDPERLVELGSHVVQPDPVLGRVPGGQLTRRDQVPEALPARLLTQVVMDAVAEGKETETIGDGIEGVPEGISDPALMPAHAPRALPGQHHAGCPHSRMMPSSRCARQTASRFTTLPPDTKITS